MNGILTRATDQSMQMCKGQQTCLKLDSSEFKYLMDPIELIQNNQMLQRHLNKILWCTLSLKNYQISGTCIFRYLVFR